MAKWVESKRHVWERNEDGSINFFAYDNNEDFHNGPSCDICYESFCTHCVRDSEAKLKEETCYPHPACSECGCDVKLETPFCPKCGAKME